MARTAAGRARGWLLAAAVAVAAVALASFGVERGVIVANFDRLESAQVTQDLQRLRTALDYEVEQLDGYGATNSIWDSSFQDLATGNAEGFRTDFPPRQTRDMFRVDGVLGVGPDGRLRVGGLTGGATQFAPVPAALARADVLELLYHPDAEAGSSTCGVVAPPAATAYLYCGFAAHRTDNSGSGVGGLVYLRALDATALDRLGARIDLPVRTVPMVTGSPVTPLADDVLGSVDVYLSLRSGDQLSLDAVIPTVTGRPVVMEVVRDRPIHRAAAISVFVALALAVALGVVVLGLVLLLVRRGIHQQVRPLRRTAQAVIDSGDHDLRIGMAGQGEIPALAAVIDRMLDTLAAQHRQLRSQHRERERQLRDSFAEQRAALRHAAMHDPLTTIANRAGLADLLTAALAKPRTNGLLIMLDLDNFKTINDTYGHATGDLVLQTVSLRLTEALRTDDTLGRLGGDEFVAWLPYVSDPGQAQVISERLLSACRRPIAAGKLDIQVTVSAGMAIVRPDDTPQTLLARADTALYAAKHAGRDCHMLYQEHIAAGTAGPEL